MEHRSTAAWIFSTLLCALGVVSDAVAQASTPLAVEFNGSDIGYPSIAAALAALRSNPDLHVVTIDGWNVVDDAGHDTFWRFALPGHPAWPSVVKQTVVLRDDRLAVDLRIRCEASRAACAALLADAHAGDGAGGPAALAPSAPR